MIEIRTVAADGEGGWRMRHEETLWGNRNILFHDFGDGHTGGHSHQNLLNTLSVLGKFYLNVKK
jgi:hypothetical protein